MLDEIEFRSLPPHLQVELESKLLPAERLLWVGQPDPDLFLKMAMLAPVLGLAVVVVAGYFLVLCCRQLWANPNLPLGVPILLAIFVLVGVGTMATPAWRWQIAKQTIYAVTSQRALIISGRWLRWPESFGPKRLERMERVQLADGYGHLILARNYYYNGTIVIPNLNGFYGIPNVLDVENIIRTMVEESRQRD